MALTDQQFNSYIRFVLTALQDMVQEQDNKKKAAKAKTLMDNLQAAIADTGGGTRAGSRTVTETVRRSAQKKNAPAPDDMTSAFQEWLKGSGQKKLSSGGRNALLDYAYRVDKVREREKVSWTELAANIGEIVKKYDTGGSEMAFGLKASSANLNALKAFETYVEENRDAPADDADS